MNFKNFLIYGFVVVVAIVVSALIVFAGEITSGNKRMKVETESAMIYFDQNTSVSELEGNAYSLNRGRIIVEGETDVTVNDSNFYPTVRVDSGIAEITFTEDEMSVRVIRGKAEIYFQAEPIELNECDYWKINDKEIKRNCWFQSDFERWTDKDDNSVGYSDNESEWQYEDVDRVIEQRTTTYVVIRVYDPYWGGYCRIRYYCSLSCYDWYWNYGYETRYIAYVGWVWVPHRHFWTYHYSYDSGYGYIDVRRDYRSGYQNTYPYRPKSVRSVSGDKDNSGEVKKIDRDFPKKTLHKREVEKRDTNTRQNKDEFQNFKKKLDTHQKSEQRQRGEIKKDERKVEKKDYSKTDNRKVTKPNTTTTRKSDQQKSNERKSAPKTTPKSTKAKRK